MDDSHVSSLRNEMNCAFCVGNTGGGAGLGGDDKLSHIYVDYNVTYGVWRWLSQVCQISSSHYKPGTPETTGMLACLLHHR